MRIRLTIATAASGRLSGVVATSGRVGPQLRAQTPRRQPRSPSQQAARALTGSLPAVWRTLCPAARAGWNALAGDSAAHPHPGGRSPLTGYTAFLSSARNLATLGYEPILWPFRPPAPIPAIRSLLALPGYNQPSAPQYLTSFPIFIDPTIPPTFWAVIRATQGLSATKGHIRQSDLRIVAVFPLSSGYSIDAYPGWTLAWGAPISSGTVTFQANLVDPASGLAGPPIRCSAFYATLQIPVLQPGTITISQSGVDIAVETDTVISFGGVPVAGAE